MRMHGRQLGMLLGTVLVLLTSVTTGWAAEAKEPPPHFVWGFQDEVKPELMEAYMKAKVADAQLCAQYKFEFPYLVLVHDFHVRTFGIFTKFAQLDDMPQKMKDWNQKTSGKAEQINQQIAKGVNKSSSAITLFRPDLSYTAQNAALVPDLSQPFYECSIYYHIKPDKYEQAVATAKKLKELNEKSKSPMSYRLYERICGPDVPTLIAVMAAKDKAAFANLDQKMKENPDKEIEKVLAENAGVLIGIETTEGTYVPEASYVPEGAF